MGYSKPQSSCDDQRSCQPSCDNDKSHSSCGGDSYGHSGGDTTIGVAQGTGVNEQHGFINVNALNGNNVLNNDLNGLHILSFG